MRVLFVGSELNPLSLAVFAALAEARKFELGLLASQPVRRGFWKTLQRTWRNDGPGTIWRGGWRLVRARTRTGLRAVGIPLQGAASLNEAAQTLGVRIVPGASINAPSTRKAIADFAPDVLLIAAFDQILKPAVLAIPRLACVNVHPSLLPARRGSNPYYWAVRHGDSRSGVTFHLIDEGIDTGDLLAQEGFDIAEGSDERTLLRQSAELAARMTPDVLSGLLDGTLTPWPQPAAGASYDPKPPRGGSRL